MSIYADRKDGKLNGRWNVRLQKGTERYRQRYRDHADAVADEERVQAL